MIWTSLGKNLSDTIGALVKHAFYRGIKKRDVGVRCASEIVDVVKENINCETENFKNFVIQEVGDGPNDSKEELKTLAEPLTGISKFHAIWINSNGKLKGQELSCLTCTVSKRCDKCDSD